MHTLLLSHTHALTRVQTVCFDLELATKKLLDNQNEESGEGSKSTDKAPAAAGGGAASSNIDQATGTQLSKIVWLQ